MIHPIDVIGLHHRWEEELLSKFPVSAHLVDASPLKHDFFSFEFGSREDMDGWKLDMILCYFKRAEPTGLSCHCHDELLFNCANLDLGKYITIEAEGQIELER